MKKKHIIMIISISLSVTLLLGLVFFGNVLLTNFIDDSNTVCKGERFSTVEEALQSMEANERKLNDTSLDYCPPYELVHSFEYDGNIIVLYSYCYSFDGEQSSDYAIRILKHNDDGTLSFNGGFTDFHFNAPVGNENYYYFTNYESSNGKKSISFLYLPSDSQKDVYVDGNKAEKELVSLEDNEFYICYVESHKDTFLSNLFTDIENMHKVEVK